MGKARRGPQLLVGGAAIVCVVLVTALLGFANESSPSDAEPVIVCVDSTVSTEGVRTGYLSDLEAVARQAAIRQARLYAAACGANATGTVGWPVERKFESSYEVGSEKAEEQAGNEAKEVTKGNEAKEEKGLEDLVETSSTRNGTPLGEMLAVAARQCGQAGGDCIVYLFTDGEWADGELKVSDGVTREERKGFLDTYVPKLTGFAGSEVNFIGVGLGTKIGEVHLNEAREVAAELVQGAGAEMGSWATRL